MVFGRRPQSPFMNAPSMEDYNPSMESQIEGDATLTVDMGNDPCCNEAREMWREGLIEGWGDDRFTNDPRRGASNS